MTKTFKNFLLMTVSLLALFSADQLIKYIIRQWGGFYICNAGVTFGITVPKFLMYTIYVLFIAIIAYLIYLGIVRYNSLSLVLVLSGAFSNLTDRIILGCVIDYIDIRVWPIFNLADVFITLGAVLLIVENVKYKKQGLK